MNIIIGSRYCPRPDTDTLTNHIEALQNDGARSLALLVCESDQWTPARLDPLLKALKLPVFGGIFPSVIHNYQHKTRGAVLVGFAHRLDMVVLENLTTRDDIVHANVHAECARFARTRNLITIVDGLSANVERFVASLYTLLGPGVNVIGGGAGTLDFIQKPCLISNKGLIQDGACVVGLPFNLHSSIQHGWEILKGPYMVSDASANLLKTLNYQPAFDVYQDQVETASGMRLTEKNFFEIAKTYPFGIEDMHGDILVRDPIRVKNRELVCVGSVPKNSMVYIMKGRTGRLIESARIAAVEAYASYKAEVEGPPGAAMILDCVSRVLFLEQAFNQEMQAIEQVVGAGVFSFGALTLGEIANVRNGPLNWLNKSTVVSLF